jgi:dTMP kinase
MKKKAAYICFEGTEGVGKTTQTQKLVDYLRSKGFSVLQTKEPGTTLAPLTMQLRGIMLDKQYDDALTAPARELISQAIRSIHMEKVILPAVAEYDFIIQDRGVLSGLAYGTACGNDIETLIGLSEYVTESSRSILNDGLYDCIIYLKGDVSAGLKKAQSSKQEFKTGDAMESRGNDFIAQCSKNMDTFSEAFPTTSTISVDNKNIDEVFADILSALSSRGVI